MDLADLSGTERDPRFPSGKWTGFFWQRLLPGRHQMTLDLSFRDGQLEAKGIDRVGSFTFSGSYDRTDGSCCWIKQYLRKHHVSYTGVSQGKGIWGAWEIRQLFGLYRDRGVFHIWPEGTTPSDEADLTEEAFLGNPPKKNLLLSIIGAVLLAGACILTRHFLHSLLRGN